MKRILLGSLVLIGGCGPETTQPMREQIADQGEVQVVRVGVFEDALAYSNRRGIYRIKDNKNGKEYLGISGIGVVEVGQHNCGKNCTARDER
jgi:hypothetical protein